MSNGVDGRVHQVSNFHAGAYVASYRFSATPFFSAYTDAELVVVVGVGDAEPAMGDASQ